MADRPRSSITLEPLLVRRAQLQRLTGLRHSRIDELIASGVWESFKDGTARNRARLVTYASVKAWAAQANKPLATTDEGEAAE